MREQQQGLYSPAFEHDNCGIGAVVNSKGIKSHLTVERALHIVENLEHRAGKDAEGKTGDGVGILLQISHKFFSKVCKKMGIDLGGEREYGIAQLFFPQDELKRNQAKKMFEIIVEKEGLELLGFREVPVYPDVLGHKAKECMPHIMQAKDWILTGSCILPGESSSRVTIILMWFLCPAVPLCIKVCSW